MKPRRTRLAAILCLAGLVSAALVLGSARGARAFVQTRSKSGQPVRWPIRCIILSPDIRGDQSEDTIEPEDIDDALTASVNAWNSKIRDCSYMILVAIPATRALEPVSDGRPSVVFRSAFWGRGKRAYDPTAIGITTVWFVNRPDDPADGQITDADIELNAVDYSFTNDPTRATPRPGTALADLENTLTHELGHVLGLGHTCWTPKKADPDDPIASLDPETQPTDDEGNPVPLCGSNEVTDKIRMSTMYPFTDFDGSTNMRAVQDDDRNGVCKTYPASSTPTACYGYIEQGACTFAAGAPGEPAANDSRAAAVAVALVAALGIAASHRRRRDSIRSCRR